MIHQYGAKASCELFHGGMFSDCRGTGVNPIGPCTVERSFTEYEGYERIEPDVVDETHVIGMREEMMQRVCDEYELSAHYDCAHGAGLAVIMPSWMEYVMHHNVMRFAQMASRVFGCAMNFENPEETAKKGIQFFRSFLKSIGMPINFEELGAREEDIPLLVEKFGLGEDGKTGGFMSLTSKDVEAIYRIAVHATC